MEQSDRDLVERELASLSADESLLLWVSDTEKELADTVAELRNYLDKGQTISAHKLA